MLERAILESFYLSRGGVIKTDRFGLSIPMAPALGSVVGEDHQGDPGGLSSTRQVPRDFSIPIPPRQRTLAQGWALRLSGRKGLEEITLG